MKIHGVLSKFVGLVLAGGLAVGALPAAAGATTAPAARATGASLTGAERASLQALSPFPAGPVATAGGVHASATSLSEADPVGDAATKSDITKIGARLTGHSLRLSVKVPGMTNPATDPIWDQVLKSHVVWAIDAGADGTFDKLVYLIAQDGGLDAWVTSATATNQVALCAGNATYDAGGILAVQIPSACVGSPAQMTFGAVVRYNWTESTPAREDEAPNGDDVAGPITSATTVASYAGAIMLDSFGGLNRINVGGLPSNAIWSEYASLGAPRGLAITPDGGHGYVVSGSGRLFGISFARNNLPPRVYGAKSWPGLNRARGVAIRPNGGAGLVVDAFGKLYPFGIGAKRVVPQLFGVPSWAGVDMARGVAVLPNGQGGYVLDAFGGLHWFSIGISRTAVPVFGAASFPGNDAARGVTILPDGTGGFVVDKSGALHFFSIGAPRTPVFPSSGVSFPGDVARGVGMLTRLIARP